jgi:hypothetical protein
MSAPPPVTCPKCGKEQLIRLHCEYCNAVLWKEEYNARIKISYATDEEKKQMAEAEARIAKTFKGTNEVDAIISELDKKLESANPNNAKYGCLVLGIDKETGEPIISPRMNHADFPAWLDANPDKKAMYQEYLREEEAKRAANKVLAYTPEQRARINELIQKYKNKGEQ